MDDELYAATLTALTECVVHGVSDKAVLDLASASGVDARDLDVVLNFKEAE